MKRRFLSVFLSLTMALSTLPVLSLAEDLDQGADAKQPVSSAGQEDQGTQTEQSQEPQADQSQETPEPQVEPESNATTIIVGNGEGEKDSLKEALDSAKAGGIIKLTKDIDITGGVTINKKVTLTAEENVTVRGCIRIEGEASGTKIENVHFVMDKTTEKVEQNLVISGVSGVVITGCEFVIAQDANSGVQLSSVWLERSAKNITIQENQFKIAAHPKGHSWVGINLVGGSPAIDTVNILNNTMTATKENDSSQAGGSSMFVVGNGNIAPAADGSSQTYGIQNLTVRDNTVLDESGAPSNESRVYGVSITNTDKANIEQNHFSGYMAVAYSTWEGQGPNGAISVSQNQINAFAGIVFTKETLPDGKLTVSDNTFTEAVKAPYYSPAVTASVNGTIYSSVTEAVEHAKDGDVVTLLQNTTENVVIPEGANITLDLDGKTLSGGTDPKDGPENNNAAILNHGTVIIQDSAGGGMVKRDDVNVGGYYVIENRGTMTINSGKVYNNSAKSTGSSMIWNGGTQAANAVLTIAGGELEQPEFTAVKNDDYGTLNITGGTIKSGEQSVQNWSDATISGGTMDGSVMTWSYTSGGTAYNSNTTISGTAVIQGTVSSILYDSGNSQSTVSIQGGTVIGSVEKATYSSTDRKYTKVEASATSSKLTVSGGSFSMHVDKALLDTDLNAELKSAANTEAPYSYYAGPEAAQNAAQPGDAVTDLDASTNPSETYTVTLNYNDGTGKTDSYTGLTSASWIKLPAPTRSGYTFRYWSDGARTYSGGEGYEVTGNAQLSAVWRANSSGSGGGGSSSSRYEVAVDSGRNGSVTVSPRNAARGTTVTVTVTPDDGYGLDALTVKDRDGSAVKLTQKGSGTYTFTMPAGRVTVEASFVRSQEGDALPFRDVARGDWFYDGVKYAYDRGLMSGVTGSSFGPGEATTRGMLVTVLWRMAGSPVVNYLMDFSDVDAQSYYGEAVRWAASLGIVSGYDDGRFGPDDAITREQLALILYGFARNQGYDTTQGGMAIREFDDYDQIAPWAFQTLDWAVNAGLISGTGSRRLDPAGSATRAQIAQILMRLSENLAG